MTKKKKHNSARKTPRPTEARGKPSPSPETDDVVHDIDRVVRINFRLISSLFLACAVLGVCVHFVHAYQVKRNAETLLERGYQAQRDGKDDDAIRYLSQYIRFRSNDGKNSDPERRQTFTDALATLGQLFEKTSRTPKSWFRVFVTCEEVLRIDPNRDDRDVIRRRIIDATLKLRRYSDALHYLRELRDHPATPQSAATKAELASLRAQCHFATRNYRQALTDSLIAIDKAPDHVAYYHPLIDLIDRQFDELPGREALADLTVSQELTELFPKRVVSPDRKSPKHSPPPQTGIAPRKPAPSDAGNPAPVIAGLLRILIAKGKPKYQAYLIQAGYHQSHDKLALAQHDVEQALQQPLKNPGQKAEVYRTAAGLALLQAERAALIGNRSAAERFLETARQHARAGLKLDPPDVRSYPVLVRADLQSRHTDDAVRYLHAGLATIERLRKRFAQTNIDDPSKTKPHSGQDRTAPTVLNSVEIELLWTLADVTISQSARADGTADTRKISQARRLIDRLRKTGANKSTVDFLEGHILFVQGQWHRAALNLEAVRPYLTGLSAMTRQLDLFLGTCYDQLSNPDRQLDVFRRALGDDPNWIVGRLRLAAALTSVNRLDEAIDGYVALSGRVPQVVTLPLVRLLILQQLQKPRSQRDWQNVFDALSTADRILPHSSELAILRAEVLAAKQDFRKARAVLHAATKQTAEAIRRTNSRFDTEKLEAARASLTAEKKRQTTEAVVLQVALVNLAVVQKGLPRADRLKMAESILATARKTYGDRVEIRLATANAARLRPKNDALQALAKLENGLKASSAGQRDQLDQGLARVYAEIGAIDRARHLWQKVAENHPTSLKPQLMLLELATQAGDKQDLVRTLKSLRDIEGAGGPNGNYAEARRLIRQAMTISDQALQIIRKATSRQQLGALQNKLASLRSDRDVLLKQARPLLEQAAGQRPYWAVVPRALGDLEFLMNNREDAIDEYRKAISLGDRSQQAVGRVVQYLYQQKRDTEADRLLKQMAQEKPELISGNLARLAVAVAWRRRQFQEAIGLAGRLVSADSRRVRDLVLLSRMRFANGERSTKEVEKPLRDAVRFALDKQSLQQRPYDAMLAYIALTSYFVRLNQLAAARQVIGEAQSRLPTSPRRLRPLTLARCYELLTENDRAEAEYLSAVRDEPDDSDLQRQLIRFYLRTASYVKAATAAGKLADAKNESAATREWANRARALALAGQGGYANGESALKLVQGVQQDPANTSLADLRTEAAILARRQTNRDRRRLITILTEIGTRVPLTIAEQFQLARLHSAIGHGRQAQSLLEKLLAAEPSNRIVMAQYVQNLIRQGQFQQAQTWLARLKLLMPNSMVIVLLKVRLLVAREQQDQAVALIQNFLKTMKPAASPEKAFRDLVLQNKAAEALALLQKQAVQQGDAEAAQAITTARKQLAAGNTEAATAVLKQYLKRGDVRLFLSRFKYFVAAKLLDELGHLPEAEQAIRVYLKNSTRPEDILILVSNLARQKRTDEALALCQEAWKTCSPAAVANTAVAIIRTGTASPAQVAQVEQQLQTAIQKYPKSAAAVMIHLADLRDSQGRYDQAEAIYRALLRQNERNLTAMNNLAWLLAIRHQNLSEAAALIDRAIGIAGPLAELLDTRAVVFLAAGDPAKAARDLETAIDDSPKALKLFHLAEAQWALNNRSAAVKTWQRAQNAGLSPKSFHPLERPHYLILLRKIASK